MRVAGILLFVTVLLVVYALVCWVLAFLRNMIRELLRRAVARCRRRLAWRRGWRGFVAEYGGDFAGPEFRWPPAHTQGSGSVGGVR